MLEGRALYMQMPFSVDANGYAYIPDSSMKGYSKNGGINFGDFFVCDATMRVLDYPFSENVQFNVMNYSQEALERLKDEYDFIIIRGSTYIWQGYDLGPAADFIEFMDMPIVLFGLGAQAPAYENINIHPGTIKFLKVVSERATSIGVRGQFTAEQVERTGVKNLDILGCPTFMRKHESHEIKKATQLQKVGITLSRHATGIFANNEFQIREVHRQLLREAAKSKASYIISQGEKEEYGIATKEPGAEKLVDKILSQLGFEDKAPSVRKLYLNRTVGFSRMEAWEKFSADLDFVIGFRLHGNIVALHQGVPAVFITCDSRVQEIAELWNLPFVKSSQITELSINKLYESADLSNYPSMFKYMKSRWINFFEKNNVKHNLGPKPKRTTKVKLQPQNLSSLCVDKNIDDYLERFETLLLETAKLHKENYTLRKKLIDTRAMKDQEIKSLESEISKLSRTRTE